MITKKIKKPNTRTIDTTPRTYEWCITKDMYQEISQETGQDMVQLRHWAAEDFYLKWVRRPNRVAAFNRRPKTDYQKCLEALEKKNAANNE